MKALFVCLAIVTTYLWAQPRDLGVEQSRRIALVVGNAAYPRQPLRNPSNDARSVAQALNDLGFQTDSAIDVNLRNLERQINAFVAQVRAGDVAVFYYAGHGIQIDGENYLVPVDFDAKDEADAKYAAYSASRIQERLDRAGARVVLVILDACRNNPFAATRSTSGGLAAMGSGKGSLIAFATAPGKTADDNPNGANGLFTSHLIGALREPGLSLDQVFNRVRERVYTESKGRQIPWTVSSVIGDVYLRPGSRVAVQEPQQQQTPAVNPLTQVRAQPLQTAPLQPAVDVTSLVANGISALERGDMEQARSVSQQALRADPTNKDALLILAGTYYRAQQWDLFVPTARQAVNAGATINLLLGHHHTLTGAHQVSLAVSKDKIAFRSMGGTCNQNPFELPAKNFVTAGVASGVNGEVFLNVKLLDEKSKQKNFNFVDPASNVRQNQNGLPIVVSPPTAQARLQALAAVLNR